MGEFISGIQQVGIGTANMEADWAWYREMFGMDIKIFVDAAPAPLMTKYTGGDIHSRIAALAMNMQGGGGFEIWQYTSRTPVAAASPLQFGDLGFLALKMKVRDAKAAHVFLQNKGVKILTSPQPNSAGQSHFYVADLNGNWFDMVEVKDDWFRKEKSLIGGAYGMVIGVSDLDRSLKFYRELLGYDVELRRERKAHADLAGLSGSNAELDRVILSQSSQAVGPFNHLLGGSQIELVSNPVAPGTPTLENRFWGDLGFIHLCYDVRDMEGLKKKAAKLNHPFTVDSADSFDMGKAAGRFSYVEDPDGTLIEFVETHKLPLVEKWGLFLNLKKRKQGKPLPRWLIHGFSFNRIK